MKLFERGGTGFWLVGCIYATALSDVWGTVPYSGAPFQSSGAPRGLLSPEADLNDAGVVVERLRSNVLRRASAHACDQGVQADKSSCLLTPGRGCMWAHVQAVNPALRANQSYSYCLPCELDGQAIPCWNPGAHIGDKQVTECSMSCSHQRRIWQPGYACSDGSNVISSTQCFSRGTASGSRCMFITYKDGNGTSRGSCGPCVVPGAGPLPCPAAGATGPEEGSQVTSCTSQCDMIDPSITQESPSPGVARPSSNPDALLWAPLGPTDLLPSAPTLKPTPKPMLRGAVRWVPAVIVRMRQDYLVTTLPPEPVWPPENWTGVAV